jgi:pimeloyl-ACP methyl ester carboxylesterase
VGAFLLLHGGRHGGWCWERVQAELEAGGQRVAAPNLPGRDGSPTTIEELCSAAAASLEELGPSVVVAHSIGGATAALLASRERQLVKGVLFAAAVVPAPGRPLVIDAYGPVLGRMMVPLANRDGLIARAAARWFFCHRLDARQRRWLLERLVVERSDLLGTRPFPPYSLHGVPCRYVLTARDRLMPPRLQSRYVGRLPGAVAVVVEGGHSIFAEHPVELARAATNFAAELE